MLQFTDLRTYNTKIKNKAKLLQVLKTRVSKNRKLIYSESFILGFQSLFISIRHIQLTIQGLITELNYHKY